jgi:hypothetical protein
VSQTDFLQIREKGHEYKLLTVSSSLQDSAVKALLTTRAVATSGGMAVSQELSAMEVVPESVFSIRPVLNSEIYCLRARTEASTDAWTSHLHIGSTSILPLFANAR